MLRLMWYEVDLRVVRMAASVALVNQSLDEQRRV